MILAHKIALDPTVVQQISLSQHAGTARFVYNWGLAEWVRQQRTGEKPSANKIKIAFNKVKYELFPWIVDVARDAHSQPFADLNTAFQRWFKKLGKRPKFKIKGKSRDSFYVSNDRLRVVGNLVRLPVIGWVRMRESLRFSGKIMSACISRIADRWFISIQVELPDCEASQTSASQIGIDMGLKTFAVTSDGQSFTAPKPLKYFLTKLARLQRRFSKRKKGSTRRKKLKLVIARLHAKIRNIRQDFLHKLSTKLSQENKLVVLENLNVSGMLKNRRLSRAIADVGWGEFRRQLEYKVKMNGGRLVVIDRWYPSSKTCSSCGLVKEKLLLSERTFTCECGFSLDRDLNAAINILAVGLAASARGPESSDSRRKPAVKLCRVETRTKPRANSRLSTN